MLKFTLLLVLPFLGRLQAAGIANLRTNECKAIKCNSGEVEMKPGQNVTFSLNFLRDDVRTEDLARNADKKNDIESAVVRRGCTLEIWKGSKFEGESYILVAKNNEDLIVKDFEDEDRDEDGDLEEFDNDVESARCTCGGNGEPGIRHGTEGFFGSLFG